LLKEADKLELEEKQKEVSKEETEVKEVSNA